MSRYVTEQLYAQMNGGVNYRNWNPLVYNVLEYGLKGDGVTDDTSALQALIDKAITEGRRTIAFPHTPSGGQYFVTALVNVEQVDFVGDNSSFIGGYGGAIQNMFGSAEIQEDFDKEVGRVTNISGYGAYPGIDSYAAIKAAYDATPDGGVLWIPRGIFDVSQTLFVDKSIHIMGTHAEENPALSATLRKTADVPIIHIRHRGVKIENLHFGSSITDTTSAIIIGSNTVQSQNVVFENIYVKGVGGDGIWLQNANNCKLHFSVINNGGHGYRHDPVDLNPPNGVYNASGNIIHCVNAFGNKKSGLYFSRCEGNHIYFTSQSNLEYGLDGNAIYNNFLIGYTELNPNGGVNLRGNHMGNLVWGRFWEGVKLDGGGYDTANRGQDPNFSEFFIEDIGRGTTQRRFVIPRMLMLPQYQLPRYPEAGELIYASSTGFSGERTLKMYDNASFKTIATREYVDRGGRGGTTAARPLDVRGGRSMYFDTTLGKPIWCKTGSPNFVTVTVTAAATTAGNLTLTLNGVDFTIQVFAGDTIAQIVKRIAQVVVTGISPIWIANSYSATVVTFESVNAENLTGTYSFNGASTGVTATVTKTQNGATPTWVDATGATV